MSARLVQELAVDGVPVAATCRVLGISRSGFCEAAGRAPSARQVADQVLTATIVAIHHASRATYGAPRVHAELRLGLGISCGRKRVARLMRTAGLVGVAHRRKRRGQRPLPVPHEDLVRRRFTAEGPDRLWCTDLQCRRRHWMSYADVRTMPMVLTTDPADSSRPSRSPAPFLSRPLVPTSSPCPPPA